MVIDPGRQPVIPTNHVGIGSNKETQVSKVINESFVKETSAMDTLHSQTPSTSSTTNISFVEESPIQTFQTLQAQQNYGQAANLLSGIYHSDKASDRSLFHSLLAQSELDTSWEFLYNEGLIVIDGANDRFYPEALSSGDLQTLQALTQQFGQEPPSHDSAKKVHFNLKVAGASLTDTKARLAYIQSEILTDKDDSSGQNMAAFSNYLSHQNESSHHSQAVNTALTESLKLANMDQIESFLKETGFIENGITALDGRSFNASRLDHLSQDAIEVLSNKAKADLTWDDYVFLSRDLDIYTRLKSLKSD